MPTRPSLLKAPMFGAVLILLALLPWSTPQTIEAAPPAQSGGPKLVLAFYYIWYNPANFSSGQMIGTPPGPYDSTQAATLERQVREATGAGIDGFIASWSGLGTLAWGGHGR